MTTKGSGRTSTSDPGRGLSEGRGDWPPAHCVRSRGVLPPESPPPPSAAPPLPPPSLVDGVDDGQAASKVGAPSATAPFVEAMMSANFSPRPMRMPIVLGGAKRRGGRCVWGRCGAGRKNKDGQTIRRVKTPLRGGGAPSPHAWICCHVLPCCTAPHPAPPPHPPLTCGSPPPSRLLPCTALLYCPSSCTPTPPSPHAWVTPPIATAATYCHVVLPLILHPHPTLPSRVGRPTHRDCCHILPC